MEKSLLLSLVLSVFNPTVGFLYGLKTRFGVGKCIIFCLFFFVVGTCFILNKTGCDSEIYAREFVRICDYGIGASKMKGVGAYAVVVSYLMSFVTNNPHLFFGLLGGIYGFFVYETMKSLDSICVEYGGWSVAAIMIAVAIFTINPYININGVRYWTATWAFLAGILHFLVLSKKRGIFYMAISVFMHLSYVIPSILLGVYLLLLKRMTPKRWSILIIISFVLMNTLDAFSLSGNLGSEGVFLHYNAYLNVDSINKYVAKKEEVSMLNSFLTKLPRYVLFFIALMVYFKRIFIDTEMQYKLYSLFALFISFTYIASLLPGLGRFYILSYSIFLVWFLLLILENAIYIPLGNLGLGLVLFVTFFGVSYTVWNLHDTLLTYNYVTSNLVSILLKL